MERADSTAAEPDRVKGNRVSRVRIAPTADEKAALVKMLDGYQELQRLGWQSAIYCPKDGTMFLSIEPGSTGIHLAKYQGEWPNGHWWGYDDDIWPCRPILFKAIERERDELGHYKVSPSPALSPGAAQGVCPFCGDDGYDISGLKLHLTAGWCDGYNAVEMP